MEGQQMEGQEIIPFVEPIFRCFHTLSSEYRNIFVDYYIGEMSVKRLARKYALSEATVKWRLNVGRSRIRERIGTKQMEKIYQRINWNTHGCNGSMNSHEYLHSQIARARRLHGQINQWISVYCGELAGRVIEELIRRGKLEGPESESGDAVETEREKPMVNGIFYIEGDFQIV